MYVTISAFWLRPCHIVLLVVYFIDLDECKQGPCKSGFKCVNTVQSYRCEPQLSPGEGENEKSKQHLI